MVWLFGCNNSYEVELKFQRYKNPSLYFLYFIPSSESNFVHQKTMLIPSRLGCIVGCWMFDHPPKHLSIFLTKVLAPPM